MASAIAINDDSRPRPELGSINKSGNQLIGKGEWLLKMMIGCH
jgi:hypothetical protein